MYKPKRNKNMCLQKNLYTSVFIAALVTIAER